MAKKEPDPLNPFPVPDALVAIKEAQGKDYPTLVLMIVSMIFFLLLVVSDNWAWRVFFFACPMILVTMGRWLITRASRLVAMHPVRRAMYDLDYSHGMIELYNRIQSFNRICPIYPSHGELYTRHADNHQVLQRMFGQFLRPDPHPDAYTFWLERERINQPWEPS